MPFSPRRPSWEPAADTPPAVASGPNASPAGARGESEATSSVTTGRHRSEKSLSSAQALDDLRDKGEDMKEGRSARRKCVMPGTSPAGPGAL